ncbi:N-acetyltransferase [Mucor ambiguus]|uniref:N-acetyltransferase n=1 Tax=Mucor ambiguus TaxID=91626 RepID=A0A0C9MRH8_9FUNG|nr:N-acetyltransferase [Mucor ambiguus]
MVPAITSSTRITLVSVTNDTLRDLADLHARVFPIAYGQKFYDEVLNAGELAKMVYYDNEYAGAICCRKEPSKYANFTARVYMMTLGVLKKYRNLGLGMCVCVCLPLCLLVRDYLHAETLFYDPGSILIEHIVETLRRQSDPIVTSIYLHVQTVNEAAIRFYTRNGFRIQSIVPNYYKLNENRDAYVLARPIFHLYENGVQQQQDQQHQILQYNGLPS